MDRAGWRAPIELMDGEAVVVPPSGGEASFAQTEIVHRLRTWQDGQSEGGRVLTDVFVRVRGSYLAPDAAWWAPGREPAIGPRRPPRRAGPRRRGAGAEHARQQSGRQAASVLGGGASELWLVDPAARAVTIVDASGERRLAGDDLITSTLLRDFAAKVAELFA